jgi:membrane-associated HD superfamily phosphohydrolase
MKKLTDKEMTIMEVLWQHGEQSIRDLVNRILDSQVADGYFRECPITFRDIQYAKTVLIEKLKTIYHTRISYPELKKQDKQETTTQQ